MKLLSGQRAYVWQMLSGFYLALFFPYVAWLSLSQTIESFNQLTTLLSSPAVFIPGMVAIALGLMHAWVGLRDVLIDYAPRRYLIGLLSSMALVWLFLIANLVWLTTQLIGASL